VADEEATDQIGTDGHPDGVVNGGIIQGGKDQARDGSVLSRTRALAANVSWHGLVLAAVLGVSAFLNLFWLPSEGYANTYYAAGVKNMLTSWHNFFFVSFDAGFVSVDKPPLGLWIQAASAWLFGFSGLSLLLPGGAALLPGAQSFRSRSGASGRAGACCHPY
jgi:hypothetical protein